MGSNATSRLVFDINAVVLVEVVVSLQSTLQGCLQEAAGERLHGIALYVGLCQHLVPYAQLIHATVHLYAAAQLQLGPRLVVLCLLGYLLKQQTVAIEADGAGIACDGIMVPFAGNEVSGCALCAMAAHAENGCSLSGGADVEGFGTLIIKCIDAVAGT